MKARLTSNAFRPIAAGIRTAVQRRTEYAAGDLASYLAAALDAASGGIHSETGALAESLYVRSTGRNDYETALEAARAAFAENPSRLTGVPPSPKAIENFEKLIAAQEGLPERAANVFVCTCVTMLAYGLYWETGPEARPWMEPGALEWAAERGRAVFEGWRKPM